jgi:hypothetical protein
MKKSQAVRLTVVAALAVAARAEQTPPAVASPAPIGQTCEERRKAANAAGTPFSETCATTSHGTRHGGFGFFGRAHSGGG